MIFCGSISFFAEAAAFGGEYVFGSFFDVAGGADRQPSCFLCLGHRYVLADAAAERGSAVCVIWRV